MPLLQKRHVLTLALRVIACLRVREEGKGVRIREPQYTQGCEKIECAQEKVNYYKEIVLRGTWQN